LYDKSFLKNKTYLPLGKQMNIKVMIVDDSSTMRRIVSSVVKQIGIDEDYIGLAVDGMDALGKLKSTKYDLILTDWNMPKMNGLQLVKNLRTLPRYANTPILMITTEGGKSEVVTALKSGVNNYIVKPFSAETLKAKLEPLIKDMKK
jgi:two-component system chemotaxis response regulator CheY